MSEVTTYESEVRSPGFELVPIGAATRVEKQWDAWLRPIPGITICVAIDMLARRAAEHLPVQGTAVSALTLSLVFGVVLGNAAPSSVDALAAGIGFTKKTLLRAAIVLYGFRLTLQDFGAAGWSVLAADVLVLTSTFALAIWIGVKLLKLDVETAVLIGAGSSICGASAVLATAPMLRAGSEQTCMAVATVAVFGTAAFLVYPLLHQLVASQWPGAVPDKAFGVYIGSTVHDVAQVIATAGASGPMTQAPAVIAKMGRVALLAPFLMALAVWSRRQSTPSNFRTSKSAMPWFPVLFAAAVVVNSFAPVAAWRAAIAGVDTWAIAAAMAALGLTTRVHAIRTAGPRPLLLAGALFVWLMVGGALINVGVSLH